MVFTHHYLGTNCDNNFWCPVVLELHSGVAIFFVLSGFLIALRYYEGAKLNFLWLKDYYVSRFARIYPLFFSVTLISLILLKSNPLEWFLSLTFLKGFFSEYKFIVISQTWTLTVEMVFYFLAPFIFILAKKGGWLILQFILIFLLGVLITSKGELGSLLEFISGHLFLFSYTFFGRSFEFLIGISLALMVLKKGVKINPGKFTYLGLVGIVLTIILISSFQTGDFRYGIFTAPGLLVHNFLLPIFIAIFFLGLIIEKTYLAEILATPIMQLLGKSSYAFYLIHLGILAELIPDFFRFNLFTFFIALNFFAVCLYFFLEKPANNRIKRLTHKPVPSSFLPDRYIKTTNFK